jgi:diphosphomevalonate decarboxylase
LKFTAEANTMQALVKYHGLKNWKLRLPFHDSISVNTTCMFTRARINTDPRGTTGIFVSGELSDSAGQRLRPVLHRMLGPRAEKLRFRIDSENLPRVEAKGLGYSSAAGAALTLLCHKAFAKGEPDMTSLSRIARLFAASASRSIVGGFSRLYAGKDDETTYSRKFADEKTLDLRMVIVPLPSRVRTEQAHREVQTSPFFGARIHSAQRRCDEMEEAILKNDLDRLGTLAEKDTLELHSITMTGETGMILMSEHSIRVISKVRELKSDGLDAYFSLQTGPSVFINTSARHRVRGMREMRMLGYRAFHSAVGEAARIIS